MVDHVKNNGMPSCFIPGTESNKGQGKRKKRGTVAVERSKRRLLKRYSMKAKKDNKAKSELEKKGNTPLQLASTRRARDLAARLRAAEHPSVSNFPPVLLHYGLQRRHTVRAEEIVKFRRVVGSDWLEYIYNV